MLNTLSPASHQALARPSAFLSSVIEYLFYNYILLYVSYSRTFL